MSLGQLNSVSTILRSILVLCGFWLASTVVNAADNDSAFNSVDQQGGLASVEESFDDDLLDSSTISWIDTRRRALAGDIVALGAYIDELMGGVETMADHNKSYVKLYLGLSESKYDDTEVLHRLRFSLDLPITKKRFRFIVESENLEDDEQNQVSEDLPGADLDDIQEEDGIRAAFRYLFEAESWDRLSLDWGAKARLDPDIFVRARGIRSWNFSEYWSLTFSPELFWYESVGAGVRTYFDLDRFIQEKYLVRFRPTIVWHERYSRISYIPRVSFYHDISQKRAVEYSLGLIAEREQNHTVISEYFSQIRYRRNLYKGWLFYQMSFGATFAREFEYETNPFISFRIEVLFSDDLARVLGTRMY